MEFVDNVHPVFLLAASIVIVQFLVVTIGLIIKKLQDRYSQQ